MIGAALAGEMISMIARMVVSCASVLRTGWSYEGVREGLLRPMLREILRFCKSSQKSWES